MPVQVFIETISSNSEAGSQHDALVLENEYLRVHVASWSGAIIRLTDKRTGIDVFHDEEGLLLTPAGETALDSVVVSSRPPEDEGDFGAIWVFVRWAGISYHLQLSLLPGVASLELEYRVLNRTLEPVSYIPELVLPSFKGLLIEGSGDDFLAFDPSRDAGLHWDCSGNPYDRVTVADGLKIAFHSGSRQLAPRQVDSFNLSLRAVSGISEPAAFGELVAMSMREDTLRIQAHRSLPEATVRILDADGAQHEAAVDLRPETVRTIPLGALRPKALQINSKGEQMVEWVQDAQAPKQEIQNQSTPAPKVDYVHEIDPRRMARHGHLRGLAAILQGIEAARDQDWSKADAHFETALLYQGDDPLLWWAKAAAKRLAGTEDEEVPELLNAHFLAPLEPMLKAEAFLNMPVYEGEGGHPMLNAFSHEDFTDCICLLLEFGFEMDAVHLLDEAIRHEDFLMARILLADLHLRAERHFEAAHHLGFAAKLPKPPHEPWRQVELDAITRLRQAFPSDAAIQSLAKKLP
ncbi:MAG: hypothetical protein JSS72_03160 [Armatimonadetes bacterium]|nr:hypothetical protein [Armatimonadota bacterium]